MPVDAGAEVLMHAAGGEVVQDDPDGVVWCRDGMAASARAGRWSLRALSSQARRYPSGKA